MSEPDPLAALGREFEKLRDWTRNRTEEQNRRLRDCERRLKVIEQRLDDAGVDGLGGRFEDLLATVTGALDAASLKGPEVPRWDRMDPDERDRELARLREWVSSVLLPEYVAGSGYRLAPCWDEHEAALWELGALAAMWRHVYERDKPGPVAAALEVADRWLPGVMRRLEAATAGCVTGHVPS